MGLYNHEPCFLNTSSVTCFVSLDCSSMVRDKCFWIITGLSNCHLGESWNILRMVFCSISCTWQKILEKIMFNCTVDFYLVDSKKRLVYIIHRLINYHYFKKKSVFWDHIERWYTKGIENLALVSDWLVYSWYHYTSYTLCEFVQSYFTFPSFSFFMLQ